MKQAENKELNKRVAEALSADTEELLPYLPYILQDFWELGSDPYLMIDLVKKYTNTSECPKILDLACGKGAVSVKIAHTLKIAVKGIDFIPDFIEYAKLKAKEFNVEKLCDFSAGDVNEAVKTERDYDCVIFGAAGSNVFGGYTDMFRKLKSVVKPGGYIFIEDGYIPEGGSRNSIKHNSASYITKDQWIRLISLCGLEFIEAVSDGDSRELGEDEGLKAIARRAWELIEEHPEKRDMFEGYILSQQNEYEDIGSGSLECATFVIRRSLNF